MISLILAVLVVFGGEQVEHFEDGSGRITITRSAGEGRQYNHPNLNGTGREHRLTYCLPTANAICGEAELGLTVVPTAPVASPYTSMGLTE